MLSSSIRRAHLALLAAAVAAVCLWPAPAIAYRPFDSTDAAVAARGGVELEVGPASFSRLGDARSVVAPSLVVNWGIAESWEAVLEGEQVVGLGANATPRLRLEETALQLKGVLREGNLQERAGVSIAAEFGVLLPTVNGEAGAGAQGTLILSQRWDALTVHLNAQLEWTRAHVPGGRGGLIAEGPDAWAVRPVAELLVGAERGGSTTRSVLAGAIWRLHDTISFDAGVRLARLGSEGLLEIRAGLSWAFSVGVPR